MEVKIIKPYFDSRTKETTMPGEVKQVNTNLGNLLIGRGFAEVVVKKKSRKKAV